MEILEYYNYSEHAIYSIIWFIPLVIGSLFASAAIGLGLGLLSPSPDIKGFAIIGTMAAGKTTLWNRILGESRGLNTSRENIMKRQIERGGKTFTIKTSTDVGGGDGFVRTDYDNLVKDKDFVIFLFDGSKLTKDDEEGKHELITVQSRLLKLSKSIEESSIPGQFHIIATHADKFIKDKNSYEIWKDRIYEKIGDKYLKKITGFDKDKNYFLIDLTNPSAIDKYINENLFNNK